MFVKPFELPIVNKRIIVLDKKHHNSRNASHHKGMQIRLNIFGDYNNKFGVLSRKMSMVTKEEEKKRIFNPGFHNKVLSNLFSGYKKEEKDVLFSRIFLRKQNSTMMEMNSEVGKKRNDKKKMKKAVSIITDRRNEEFCIRNMYVNSDCHKNMNTLLTVKKIPKDVFRKTLHFSPKAEMHYRFRKYFNATISNSNNTISTNENRKS